MYSENLLLLIFFFKLCLVYEWRKNAPSSITNGLSKQDHKSRCVVIDHKRNRESHVMQDWINYGMQNSYKCWDYLAFSCIWDAFITSSILMTCYKKLNLVMKANQVKIVVSTAWLWPTIFCIWPRISLSMEKLLACELNSSGMIFHIRTWYPNISGYYKIKFWLVQKDTEMWRCIFLQTSDYD